MNRFLATLIVLCVSTLLAGTGTSWGIEIVDPHEEPATCKSCHSQNPTPDDIDNGDYLLLAEGIDLTCNICHPYDCCRIYSLKGHNHPSNVGEWDIENFTEPKTVPLFDGLITCNTCHYHRRVQIQGGDDYQMVRMVKVELDRIDWTALCLDCHIEY